MATLLMNAAKRGVTFMEVAITVAGPGVKPSDFM
jgi:hypothetical protein